jgi:hypothetical protein
MLDVAYLYDRTFTDAKRSCEEGHRIVVTSPSVLLQLVSKQDIRSRNKDVYVVGFIDK